METSVNCEIGCDLCLCFLWCLVVEMPREKRLSARQPKHKEYSDSDEESDRETMVRSPPKKPKKNSVPAYLDNIQAESGAGIMTPVIKTSNASTQPQVMLQSPPLVPDESIQSYPCGTCHSEVNDNDDAIFCESGCSRWYHRVCAGLTEHAYDLLTNEDNADWVCDECISKKNIPLVKLKS